MSLNLKSLGITSSKELSADVRKLIKQIAKINDEIVDLVNEDETDAARLKQIKAEIREKCKKLLEEQKEIKQDVKARVEKKLLLLGERNAYHKELKANGIETKKVSLSQISRAASSRNVLAEVEMAG